MIKKLDELKRKFDDTFQEFKEVQDQPGSPEFQRLYNKLHDIQAERKDVVLRNRSLRGSS